MGAGMGRVDGAARPGLLADADVIIDYQKSDRNILGLVARHIGSLAVVSLVVAEVRGLTSADCRKLGMDIIAPTRSQLLRAGEFPSRVSFNDRLSFLICRDDGRTCVTNDRALCNLCQRHGVQTRFGLDLMVDLAAAGVVTRSHAEAVARSIRESNSLHLNEQVLRQFHAALNQRLTTGGVPAVAGVARGSESATAH